MKATIRQRFMDHYTKKLYRPGDVVEFSDERIAEIKAKLPNAIEVPEPAEEPAKKEPAKKAAPKKSAKKAEKAEN